MTIRVGIMGCASVALRSVIPALQADPSTTVTAVASRTPGRAAQVAQQIGCAAVTGYEALVDHTDVDALYVPLPTGLHHEWIRAGLRAGKHVLAEKSLTTAAHLTADVVALARSRSLVLMENFMFLRHDQHRRVGALLDAGAIGGLRGFSAAFAFPPRKPDDIRYRADLGGGALLDAGAYTVRSAQQFLGADLEVAGAVLGVDRVTGVDVRGSALLVCPDGVPAQLSWGFDHAYRCTYTLWGTHGSLRLDRAFTTPAGFVPGVVLERGGDTELIELEADDHFAGSVAHFARLVDGDGGDDGRAAEYAACLRQSELLDEIGRAARRRVCEPIHASSPPAERPPAR